MQELEKNSIINNYDTDFKYTYSHSVNGDTRLKIPKKNDKNYFEMNVFLECITYRIPRKKTIREMLDLIIEYNEFKRR